VVRRKNMVDVLTMENDELILSLAKYTAEASKVRRLLVTK
jgi:hypothetical protein